MLDVNPAAATATTSQSFHSFPSELYPAERFVGRQGEEGKGATTHCSAQELLRAAILVKTSVPGTTLRDIQMFLGADSAANIL